MGAQVLKARRGTRRCTPTEHQSIMEEAAGRIHHHLICGTEERAPSLRRRMKLSSNRSPDIAGRRQSDARN